MFRIKVDLQMEKGNCAVENRVILSVLVGLSIILIGLTLFVGFFVFLEWKYTSKGFYDNIVDHFSIPCEDLSLSPDEDFDLFSVNKQTFKYSVDGNRYICTFKNLTQILHKCFQRFSRLRVAQGLEKQLYLQCGNDTLRRKSGELTALFSKILRNQSIKDESADETIFWDTRPKRTFIADSIQHNKGEIRVPEGRYYFVYAGAQFNLSKLFHESIIDMRKSISLRICASTHGYERTLLSKSKLFKSNDKDIVSSLNVAGLLYLSREDDLYVKTSNSNGITAESRGNYFGLFPFH